MRIGLSLNDILTRITPGAVFISSFLITPDFTLFELSSTSVMNTSLVLFVVFSFIFGEAIDLTRENFKPIPATFRRFLYHETGREEFLGITDKWRLKLGLNVPERRSIYASSNREVYYEIISKFGLENDYDYVRDLYTLLINDLDSGLSARTKRLQTNYIFADNLSIALVGFTFIVTLRGLSGGPTETLLALILTLFSLLSIMSLILAFDFYGRVEYRYVDSLVSEFFVKPNQRE